MPDSVTPAMYVTDTMLGGWPGVGVYTVSSVDGHTTPISWTPTGQGFRFLGVSTISGQGTWWMPVAPRSQVPQAWLSGTFGGIEQLAATGPGIWSTEGTDPVMRPAMALWWIPATSMPEDGPVIPSLVNGDVSGTFPSSAPTTAAAPTPAASASPWPFGP